MLASVYIILLFIGIVLGADETKAKLRFYHSALDNFTELPIDQATDIFPLTWYNSSRVTVIFCHGYTGKPDGPAVTAVIKTYLELQSSNVALLNWDRLAATINSQVASSYINSAVPNAIKLGADFADVLLRLSSAGLNLNMTHLIGHSLGAHIFGIAGNKMVEKGVQLPWMTALDPAGVMMDSKPSHQRLSSKSAMFVEVVHSDPRKYGSRKQLGTVDLWPNYRNVGPVVQPGCDNKPHPRFSPEDLCNHHKCWQYLVDSLKYPGTILGSYAKNYPTWKKYSMAEREAVVFELGKYNPNATPGNYYFVTSEVSPYGLGKNGL